MNKFTDRFTAVLDACVLVGALKRDLLLSLAEAGFFRPRWSLEIINEMKKYLSEKRCLNAKKIDHVFTEMRNAFPEAEISGHEVFLESGNLGLPDPNDEHVLAVALMIRASVIVTDNLKDFPNDILEKFNLKPKSSDEFITETILLSPRDSKTVIDGMLAKYNNPPMNINLLIQKIEEQNLKETASTIKTIYAFTADS